MIKTNRFLSIKEVSEYIKILVMRIRKLKRRSNINECIKSKKVI